MKIKKAIPNLPLPLNREGRTFEEEQNRELESELLREIFGFDKRARVSYPE
jgi:hypothetical protein